MQRSEQSFVSVITAIACTLTLVALLLPAIDRMRSVASKQECAGNLKRLGLALHNYHDTYRKFPFAAGGTTGAKGFPSQKPTGNPADLERLSNRGRLSGFAFLLPFLEQMPAWDKLYDRKAQGEFQPMGPSPSYDPKKFPLWGLQVDVFLCPADSAVKGDFGMRSYCMNYGDTVDRVGRLFTDDNAETKLAATVCRGTFAPHKAFGFRDIPDGMESTLFLSETKIGISSTDPGARVARGVDGLIDKPALVLGITDGGKKGYQKQQQVWSVGKGTRWPEGAFMMNAFTTVLPPNSPSATLKGDPESGCISASSYHPSGVNVVFADAAVHFISDSIDTGDLNAASVSPKNGNAGIESPYGVWGAIGTRASKEVVPSMRDRRFGTGK